MKIIPESCLSALNYISSIHIEHVHGGLEQFVSSDMLMNFFMNDKHMVGR
jgi:hypothetical protein